MKKSILSKSDLKFLNERGLDEILASNTYRYAATCLQRQSLFGFEAFFRKESKDELKHRTILENFANNMGAELDMPAIPAIEFASDEPMAILNHLYKMELDLLAEYETGMDSCDRGALKSLCKDMVDIQIEGVGAISDLIAQVESTSVEIVDLTLRK
jgi:ferritin